MQNLRDILSGAKYPASKEDLLHYARENHLSEDVLKAIQGLRDRSYNTVGEVAREALL